MSSLKKKLGNGGGLTYGEWCSINSYKGWLKECDGHALYNKYIRPLEKYNREYKQGIKSGRIKAPEKIVYYHSVFY